MKVSYLAAVAAALVGLAAASAHAKGSSSFSSSRSYSSPSRPSYSAPSKPRFSTFAAPPPRPAPRPAAIAPRPAVIAQAPHRSLPSPRPAVLNKAAATHPTPRPMLASNPRTGRPFGPPAPASYYRGANVRVVEHHYYHDGVYDGFHLPYGAYPGSSMYHYGAWGYQPIYNPTGSLLWLMAIDSFGHEHPINCAAPYNAYEQERCMAYGYGAQPQWGGGMAQAHPILVHHYPWWEFWHWGQA